MLPVGDSPNPRTTPWVNYGLIVANVAVFLVLFPLGQQAPDPSDPLLLAYLEAIQREVTDAALLEQVARQLSRYDLVVFAYGFRPAAPEALDMLTSMFLHGGLAHLAGNMLFLWIFGDNVEDHLGRLGYLAAYLGTGVAAAAGDALLRAGSEIPSVGASGAISGVLGLYFVAFPHNRVRVFLFLFPIWAGIVELPARLVLGMYVLFDNLLPVLIAGAQAGGVSYGAHLGGFVAGATLAVGLGQLGLTAARLEEEKGPVRAHLDAARELLERRRPSVAYQHLIAAQRAGPSPEEANEIRGLIRLMTGQTTSVPRRALDL